MYNGIGYMLNCHMKFMKWIMDPVGMYYVLTYLFRFDNKVLFFKLTSGNDYYDIMIQLYYSS